jgi:hypothetical protein
MVPLMPTCGSQNVYGGFFFLFLNKLEFETQKRERFYWLIDKVALRW